MFTFKSININCILILTQKHSQIIRITYFLIISGEKNTHGTNVAIIISLVILVMCFPISGAAGNILKYI